MATIARRRIATLAVAVLALPGLAAVINLGTAAPAAAACAYMPGDFNGDGHGDVAAGQPLRTVMGANAAGAVSIILGGAAGFNADSQYVDESEIGTIDTPQAFDVMGLSTAAGNFNGDCFADIAIGIPGDDEGEGNGAILVFYGSATGFHFEQPVRFKAAQFGGGVSGFGDALVTGDFNGDGLDDLAIGADESNVAVDDAGEVLILIGSSIGLQTNGARFYTQDTPGVPGASETGDVFGASLAAGDFNGDHIADLAVGAPGEDVGTVEDAGSVTVLYGSPNNLTGTGSQAFTQNTAGVPGTAEFEDDFGFTLAAGDITGDGRAELLVGDPEEGIGSASTAGSVTVFKGASGGVTTSGIQNWTQNSPGVPGTAEKLDEFGIGLTVGDFNGDGHADAAIGAPGESLGSIANAGTVDVLYGRSSGLTGTGAQAWSQDSSGIAGSAEAGDDFGNSLQVLKPNGSTNDALVIGVPGEDSSGLDGNGALAVIFGGAHGLTSTGNLFIDGSNLEGGASAGAALGLSHAD